MREKLSKNWPPTSNFNDKTSCLAAAVAMALISNISLAADTTTSQSTLALPTASAQSTESLTKASTTDSAITPNKSSKLSLTTTLSSKSVEDKIVNSKTSGALVGLTGERTFTPYLSGVIDITMIMMTGNFSNRYTAEGGAPNGLDISEASLTGKLWSHETQSFSLSAGVMPIDFTTLISMWDGPGFAGIKESYNSDGDQIKGQIWASQTTPSSSTAAVKSSESGINSQLQLVGANISTNNLGTSPLTFKAGATRFDFQNLTSSAATDSQYAGNSVVQIGNQAKFKYQFKGYEGAASMGAKLNNHWQMEFLASYLTNTEAPTTLNKAQMGQIKTSYLGNDVKYTTSVASFYNEADTLPASYTVAGLGNNNRFGWSASFKSEWEKQKVSAILKFVQANEIQDNIYTADRQILSLSVEAKYDIL